MFKKLLGAFGMGGDGGKPPGLFHEPYADLQVNMLYNLLFCDNLDLFRNGSQHGDALWTTLLAGRPDVPALQKIAADAAAEGRVRALACARLRAAGAAVPHKLLLGTIIEVPQQGGLDVLAAFCDGGVRYLNQSGRASIFEGSSHPAAALARELLEVSQAVVEQIGPWDKARLPPPQGEMVRLSFLVSDGLYFGQGPWEVLQRDAKGGPLLGKATQLLQQVVAMPR
ncbi:MAG: hypothetical protein JNJ60_05745 [Rhodocyclaceae bacterium]|nr:hypothetical protein [Rhodocyclaceae bacterium]